MELNNIEVIDRCPWCGSINSTKWCKDQKPFLTVECGDCNIVYVKNRLNEKGREEYYKYYNTEKHQELVKSELRDEMYKLEYDFVTNFIDGGNVLDVGCGGGFFLDVFDSSRFDKFGVEYGDDGFNTAYGKYPDKVYQGQFPDLDNIENDSFDLIIFRGVLEHVVNPKDYLMKASQVLKNNGWLFISATPNLNSLCADLFRDKFNQHIQLSTSYILVIFTLRNT